MRNIFIGLSSAFDNTRNLELKKTNKNKDFLEETNYIISTEYHDNSNKTNETIYVDISSINLSSNFINMNT
jgi:hypothetical protein